MPTIVHLHPMLVHFPIALFFTSVFFDLAYQFTRNTDFKKIAYYLLILGVGFGIFASGVGIYIEDTIEKSGISEEHIDDHKGFAIATMVCFIVLLIFRFFKKNQISDNVFKYYLILSLVGLMLLSLAGFYGGRLVYEDGAAVHLPDKTAPK
ncbi:MAG: DUF2231 domain-containing protein [Nitrospirae bacterium]|nr:DUF2231 domain-containing protein [Nitrospirota bacterium]MBI3352601.1 DUF2231 domain-containing protein [Nitrospirota bacterium]